VSNAVGVQMTNASVKRNKN